MKYRLVLKDNQLGLFVLDVSVYEFMKQYAWLSSMYRITSKVTGKDLDLYANDSYFGTIENFI